MVRTRSGKQTHPSDSTTAEMEVTIDALKTMFQELLAQSEEKMMSKIDELKEEMRTEWREDMGHYLEKGKSPEHGNTSAVVEPPLPSNPNPSPNLMSNVSSRSPRPNPISPSPNASYHLQQPTGLVSATGQHHFSQSHREPLSPSPTNHPPPTYQPQSLPYYPLQINIILPLTRNNQETITPDLTSHPSMASTLVLGLGRPKGIFP
ncbi:hypothetical protein Dimus_039045 [Dionaea muscipula]